MDAILARLVAILLVVTALACGSPDRSSGDDGERHQARALTVGTWQSDSVSFKVGDRTDWKLLEILDTGFLTIELVLDDPDANILLALHDRHGIQTARVTHRSGDGPQSRLISEVGSGRYFIQVQALGKSDNTGYTIRASVR
jgi:hypothetical protein